MSCDDTTTIDPADGDPADGDVGVEALLAAADPLPAGAARALPLAAAHDDLCRTLLAHPRGVAAATQARRSRRRPRLGLLPRLALAVAVVFAVSMAALSLGKSGEKAGTVWAAELVRLAEASPLVLLDADGWRVIYTDEQSEQEGEMHFTTASPSAPQTARAWAVPGSLAQLNWRGVSLEQWKRGRAASSEVTTTAPVLGTTASVYQYFGGKPGQRDITAIWRYDDRVLEFRAVMADIAAFKALLAQLKQVDTDSWLSALPDSVVKTTDRSDAIAEMLRGVALPPGFDPRQIKGAALTKDRYQLGAAVTGTVACTWISRWSQARRRGDRAGVREAIAAMATAKDWPILDEMAKSGAYPQVLEQYAAAMAKGSWHGRPLEGDATSGLGCDVRGVPLR